jgi:3',5'-cyclic AMP phosphodiesterase CpdA
MTRRLLHFSDLHLHPSYTQGVRNWERCLEAIDEIRPDLVVLGGDVVFDDPDDMGNHSFSRAMLERIGVAWRVVPGNHDIGDSPSNGGHGEFITEERRRRYIRFYGADHWSVDLEAWRIIGLNSSLLASGLAAEADQASWLRGQVADWTGPIGVFIHAPLCMHCLDESEISLDVVSPMGRMQLLAALDVKRVRFVASGHLHCAREFYVAGLPMIWAPSTSMVTDRVMAGHRRGTGWVAYTFDGEKFAWNRDGQEALRPVNFSNMLNEHGRLRQIPAPKLAKA